MKAYIITTKGSKRLKNGKIGDYPSILPEPEVFYGPVPGDPGTEVPDWYNPTIKGATVAFRDTTYCCYLSKLNCLKYHLQRYPEEDCLLLEDDVVFHPLFNNVYASFIKKVPEDWGILWLGGHHSRMPTEIAPGVLKPSLIWNAECMLFKARYIPYIIGELEKGKWPCNHHVDNVLCWIGNTVHQYSPLFFIAGQHSGFSEIRKRWRVMRINGTVDYIGLDGKPHTSGIRDYAIYND